ncbi:MAG: hypothetical protein HPY45_08165 [Anaerolineae bacterium]|nr:hypothetical protein [Anaerolineae bacterium]
MDVDPIKNFSADYHIYGLNNPYRIANPNIKSNPAHLQEGKAVVDSRKPSVALSPYRNISQTITRTMSELSGEQRNFILEQYTRTDAILDKLGYYR